MLSIIRGFFDTGVEAMSFGANLKIILFLKPEKYRAFLHLKALHTPRDVCSYACSLDLCSG